MRFIDTNIFLYSVSCDPIEAGKANEAASLLEADDPVVSVQVLQEFYVQATRASRCERLSHLHAVGFIEKWLRFRVQELTVPLLQSALSIKHRHGISYWDSAIIAAAQLAGCGEIVSEDLAHGHAYEGISVINPFV